MKNSMNSSSVIWITGLSGSGKTTLAKSVVSKLRSMQLSSYLLDGDEMREVVGLISNSGDTYSRESRLELAFTYSRFCKSLVAQNINVVVATISLFHEVHEWNRQNIGGYKEVFLDTPLDELRARDPKGLYTAYDGGYTKDIVGLDMSVDFPKDPDLVVKFKEDRSVDEIALDVVNLIGEKNAN